MRSLLWAIAVLLIFVGLSVGMVGVGFGLPLLGGEQDSSPPVTKLYGGGSSFIDPLMKVWCEHYAKTPKGKPLIYYEPVGSGSGVENMIKHNFDFGATDAFISDADLRKAQTANGEILHLPLAMGAVVAAYNLPTVQQPIRLDPATLTAIFLRKIKKWNDPALVKLNEDLALPDLDIKVVHRSDKSGTTAVFTEYLSKVSPTEWGTARTGVAIDWPEGTDGVKGNDGVRDYIQSREGAIGYLELTYAKELRTALLKNREGTFTRPDPASVSAAAEAAVSQVQSSPDLRFSLTHLQGKNSYPISATVYAVVYVQQKPEKAKLLADFFRWATHEGQQYCVEKQYVPLPEGLVKKIEPMLDKIGK